MLSILSALSFNIAVSMREAIILSIANGASFIPFVKSYITLPCTFLVGACYLLLNRRIGSVLTYTAINTFFLAYFVIFSLFIVPNYDSLTLNAETAEQWRQLYPNLRHFVGLIEHWPSALFHVSAEIWSIYIFIILFWQVANESMQPGESTQFYPLVTFLISFGTTLAAYPIQKMSQSPTPLLSLLMLILPLGLLMNLLVLYINRNWALDAKYSKSSGVNSTEQSLLKKIEALFSQSLSPEVISLSICVFSFNFLISLFESCFWTRVSTTHASQQSLLDFYSFYTLLKGGISMLCSVINIYLLRVVSWNFVISISPLVAVTAIHLFFLFHFPQWLSTLSGTAMGDIHSYAGTLYFFAFGLVLSYATKFSFFDPAKEILISKLHTEERRVSKVFADGLGGRAGKIFGGVVQSVLLGVAAVDSILDILPAVMVFASVASIFYLKAIYKLQSSHDAIPRQLMAST